MLKIYLSRLVNKQLLLIKNMFKIYNFFKGKKTLIVSICGLVYGIGTQNQEIIYISLGMLGLRDAIRLK